METFGRSQSVGVWGIKMTQRYISFNGGKTFVLYSGNVLMQCRSDGTKGRELFGFPLRVATTEIGA